MARLFLWIHEELTVGNHTPLASIFTLGWQLLLLVLVF